MKKLRKVTKANKHSHLISYFVIFVLSVGLIIGLFVLQQQQKFRSNASSSTVLAEQTDRTNLSFTSNGYTSEYHLYAGGLDWNKTVGLLIYTDGSGEYGLKNPTSDYLLAGTTGMIAVAKKHNMILLTPLSPNKNCSDGDGSCWYLGDTGGYTKWAEALVTSVESQYPIDKKRVAFGGYSSGAELATGLWTPAGSAQRTMDDGVIVAISYGDPPFGSATTFTPAFTSTVHMHWNVGDADAEAYKAAKDGQAYYGKAGFQTTIDVLPGVTHDRSGQFGGIMDAQITAHVPAAAAIGSEPTISGVNPTYVCAGSGTCVPSGTVTPTVSTSPDVTINPTEDLNVTTVPSTSVTQTPTDMPIDPSLSPELGGGGNDGGLIQLFLQFLAALLRFFASLFN